MLTVLVTGGTGYIGSHVSVELLQAKHDVIILDNLSNSSKKVLDVIAKLGGRPVKAFYDGDLRNQELLDKLFSEHKVDSVIHMAAMKSVGESCSKPLMYYGNNVYGTICLLEAMERASVRQLVFSSSATVYSEAGSVPKTESSPLGATNPYGRTKLMMEQIMEDLCKSSDAWQFLALRYFNPIGAHPSGDLGEDPKGIPNNLMPFVAQTAAGIREKIMVFGSDYDTKDGTGVRDYVHVVDLAKGHLAALSAMRPGFDAVNLGTGVGASVFDCIHAMEKAVGKKIPFEVTARRPGDIATSYADPSKAKAVLKWTAEYTLDEMCRDLWNWQSKNPNGFNSQ